MVLSEEKSIYLKKNSSRELHPKKKFLHKKWTEKKIRASRKYPTPPYHFSNGPSLRTYKESHRMGCGYNPHNFISNSSFIFGELISDIYRNGFISRLPGAWEQDCVTFKTGN